MRRSGLYGALILSFAVLTLAADCFPITGQVTIAITSPEDGSSVGRTFTVAGEVGGAVDQYEFVQIDVNGAQSWPGIRSDNTFSAQVSVGSSVSEAVVTVTPATLDRDLARAFDSVTVYVDSGAPTIRFSAGAPTSAGLDTPRDFGFTATDSGGVERIEYRVGSAYWDMPSEWTVAEGLDGLSGTTVTDVISVTFTNSGSRYLEIRAVDAAGNVSSSVGRNVSVDGTAPSISVSSPSDGDTITDPFFTVSGTATDNNGVVSITFDVNGTEEVLDVDPVTTSYNYSYDLTELSEGTYDIIVTATDTAGLTAEAEFSVTVENALDVNITSPSDGSSIASQPFDVNGTASGGWSDIEAVFVFVDSASGDYAQSVSGNFDIWTYEIEGLAGGTHIITVRVEDVDGRQKEESITVYLDTTPPIDPIIHVPASGNPTVFESSLTVEVEAADVAGGSGIGSVRVNLDGGTWRQTTYNSDIDRWTYEFTSIAYGDREVNAQSFDNAENVSTTVSRSFVRDDKPTVSVSGYADDAVVNVASTSFSISGSADDNEGLVEVYRRINGGSAVPMWNTGGVASTSWSDTITLPQSNGNNTIRVYAKDVRGNLSDDYTVEVRVDTTAPGTPTIASPSDGATVADSVVTISGTATDNLGVETVKIVVDSATTYNVDANGSTSYSYSYDLNIDALATGSHTVDVTALDAAGNESATAASISFAKETRPTVSIDTPAVSQVYTSSSPYSISGSATDDFGSVSGVQVRVDGGTWQSVDTFTAGTPASWSHDVALSSGDGSYLVEVKATDDAGFESSFDSVTVILDTASPAVTISSPDDGSVVVATSTPYSLTVSGSVSDTNIDTVEYRVDGGSWTAASGTASWTANISLSSGEHDIEVRATDKVGNTDAAAITVDIQGVTTINVSSSWTQVTTVSAGDVYWYRVYLYSGSTYAVQMADDGVDGMTANMRLTVYDDTDQSNVVGGIYRYDDAYDPAPTLTASFTGYHYILVEQNGTPSSGSFQIRVY